MSAAGVVVMPVAEILLRRAAYYEVCWWSTSMSVQLRLAGQQPAGGTLGFSLWSYGSTSFVLTVGSN